MVKEVSANPSAILWALNQQEASGQRFVKSRFEPGFYRLYLKNNPRFKEAERTYGRRAVSSSYGPWQIMYATAVQFGYGGRPQDLSHAFVSLPYVVKYLDYLEKRLNCDAASVVSAYNAGLGGVGTNPEYTERVLAFLRDAPASKA